MKVVFLARRFYPDVGGVEKHVYEISKALIKKGHKVTVITQSEGDKDVLDGIKIVRISKAPKGSSEKLQIWKWIISNRKLFQNADIVHSHDVFFWYLPIKLLFPSKKSFITFHGYESYPISKKSIFVRKISELLANGNIVVGDFIKKWYHTTPNYVTYGGVEISNIKYQISNKPKRDSAIFIGRLDEHTGVLDYAKAVDLIKKEYPKFRFAIIGDGRYKERLERYRPLGFKKETTTYLKRYNFAFVSRYLSILEALANRRLVFALYDNPVKEDYLRMSPFARFIVIAQTSEKLARKVTFFLNNPIQQEKFVNAGFSWVKDQTWENVLQIYLSLWRKK
ncbi:MAG: glycosyltransferase family 4 protein [Candidatus Levybacteria bacterium]|nr:glycosyltransferase family 4 protein [Candidatus Levybacteria bacterium]